MNQRLTVCIITALLLWASAQAIFAASPEILEGAKREGTLMLYTSMNAPDVKQVFAAFQKKYPFIDPKFYTTRSAALLQRTINEAQAKRYAADIVQANAYTIYVLVHKKLTTPYGSPESSAYPEGFHDPDRHWTAVNQQLNVIGYNTKLVNPKEAPRTYEDLLNPKWKGKLALDDKQYIWYDGMMKVMGKEKGLAFMKKLATQDIHFRSGQTLMAQLLSAGEFGILINTRPDNMEELKQKGAPTAWVSPNPTTVNILPISLFANAPHPNAGKLFIDYVLSEEGQKLLGVMGRTPARPKIPTTYTVPDVKLVVNDLDQSARLNEIAAEYKKVFNLP
jgi:iron(III) transport system substrate-binding protein